MKDIQLSLNTVNRNKISTSEFIQARLLTRLITTSGTNLVIVLLAKIKNTSDGHVLNCSYVGWIS